MDMEELWIQRADCKLFMDFLTMKGVGTPDTCLIPWSTMQFCFL